jgi:hypothetical protein
VQSIVKALGIAGVCVACLGGCVLAPASFIVTWVVPHAINGKGLPEDAADLVTGKDCRVIESIVRKDRKTCETRDSPETRKDFKGLAGLLEDRTQSRDEASRSLPGDQAAANEDTALGASRSYH